MVGLCEPHSLKAGEESHAFRYWKKRWTDKSHCTACQLPFFELKMLPWSPEQTLFFPMTLLLRGKMDPGSPHSPISSLCSAFILTSSGPHSLILVVPLLISSQPIQSSKGPLSLPCLGCTTIKLERKEFKQRMNRKNDFSPWHIIGFMLITFLFLRKSNSPISLELLTRYKWLPWERVMDGLAAWFTCLQSWHARLTFVW